MPDFIKRVETTLQIAQEGFAKGAEGLPQIVQWIAVAAALLVMLAQFVPQ